MKLRDIVEYLFIPVGIVLTALWVYFLVRVVGWVFF
jgi:hypothetical protein